MKTVMKKMLIVLMTLALAATLFTVAIAATEVTDSTAAPTEQTGTPDAAPTAGSTVAEVIRGVFSGTNLALLGAALAVALPCMGSAKGVGIVGEASGGLLSEDPSKFGKALALQALPMTQGVYGLVAAFLMLAMLGLFGDITYLQNLTFAQGGYYLMASLPIALAGYYSAIRQGRVAASGINLLSKRPGELGKAITSAALVETYAIFALLITLLLVFFSPFKA